jgi:hypothetical protein
MLNLHFTPKFRHVFCFLAGLMLLAAALFAQSGGQSALGERVAAFLEL